MNSTRNKRGMWLRLKLVKERKHGKVPELGSKSIGSIYIRKRLCLVRGLLGEQSVFKRLAKAMHIDPKLCHWTFYYYSSEWSNWKRLHWNIRNPVLQSYHSPTEWKWSKHIRNARWYKKKGCPSVHQAHNAVYHNWFSPFLWSQILIAGQEAGWKMSTSEIHNWLQKRDPTVFAKISWTTINEWIDWSGLRPRWSEKALQMAEMGNHQLHPNAGCRGALVSNVRVWFLPLLTCCDRLLIQMSLRPLQHN